MTNTNTTSTNEFAFRIKALLSASTSAWRQIATVLADAVEQYEFESDRFKVLLKEVAFTKATASKLIQIARDKRIAANAELFDTCNAWTVLYEITTLNDEQFDQLVNLVEEANSNLEMEEKGRKVLTVATVRAIKNGDNKPNANPYRPAFSISIDVDALRTQEFDFENYEELMRHVRAIANEISFVKIEKTEVFEKQNDQYLRKLQKAYDAEKYACFKEVIENYTRDSCAWKAYRSKKKAKIENVKCPPLEVYSDFAEAKAHFLADPDDFFITMGVEIPNPGTLADKARRRLDRNNRRYLERLRLRPETPTSLDMFDALDESDFGEVKDIINELRDQTSIHSRVQKVAEAKIAA